MKPLALLPLLMCVTACDMMLDDEIDDVATDTAALSTTDCVKRAAARIAGWKAQRLTPAEIERRRQLAQVACADTDVDSVTAVFVGTANVDYYRLAMQAVRGTLTAREYGRRLADRARKLKRARTDPAYLASWIAGDADRDLVPDASDMCTKTADLAATDDRGCPSDDAGPPIDDAMFRVVIDEIGLMRSRGCDGAPQPETPTPLEVDFSSGMPLFVVSRVANQPADCEVFYEIMADTPSTFLHHRYSQMLFRASESQSTDPERVVLPLLVQPSPGRTLFMQHLITGIRSTWRVRAVNGNGAASEYSMPLGLTP